MTKDIDPLQSIPFATSISPAKPPRLGAAVWIGIFGLGLVFAGGCFLIGIMETLWPQGLIGSRFPVAASTGLTLFIVLLYVLAFCCFIGAVLLLVRSVKLLSKLLDT